MNSIIKVGKVLHSKLNKIKVALTLGSELFNIYKQYSSIGKLNISLTFGQKENYYEFSIHISFQYDSLKEFTFLVILNTFQGLNGLSDDEVSEESKWLSEQAGNTTNLVSNQNSVDSKFQENMKPVFDQILR